MENAVLLEVFSADTEPLTAHVTRKRPRIQTPPPAFLAMELSSDRQMEVSLRSVAGPNDDVLKCLVVAVSDLNRKTYIDGCCVGIQGLHIPAPKVEEPRRRQKTAR